MQGNIRTKGNNKESMVCCNSIKNKFINHKVFIKKISKPSDSFPIRRLNDLAFDVVIFQVLPSATRSKPISWEEYTLQIL